MSIVTEHARTFARILPTRAIEQEEKGEEEAGETSGDEEDQVPPELVPVPGHLQ